MMGEWILETRTRFDKRQCHGAALWHMAIFVAAESLPALHGVALRLDEHTSPSFV